MADRVTCCPHCSTSFRVTDAQLQTARGAVRCGSCLQIFRAPDHLLPLPETPVAPAPADKVGLPGSEREDEPPHEPQAGPGVELEDTDIEGTGPENAQFGCDRAVNRGYDPDHDPSSDPDYDVDHDELEREPQTEPDTSVPALTGPDDTVGDESGFFDDPRAMGEREPVALAAPSLYDDALIDDASLDDSEFALDLDEDVLISDDMGLESSSRSLSLGDLSEDFLDTDTAGKTVKSSLFDRELKVKEVESDHSDESWAEELLQEIETENAAEEPPQATSDILKSFGEFTTAPPTRRMAADDDLSNADELTEDGSGYRRSSTGSFDELDDIAADTDDVDSVLGERFSARKEPLFSITDERDSPDETAAGGSTALAPAVYATPPRGAPAAAPENDLLHGISSAPVEMDWHIEESPWPKRLLWGGLSLVACLLLVAQVAYFKFDHYSRIEPWRSAYGALCQVAGCTLPPLSDPARVKAYNLVVRSSPQAENALIVDSILLNTAGFPQPFPDFVLSFTDLQGKQLAYRRFTPKEYLGGEMAGASLMPSGQPVHISLEIVDPGAAAVNYTATIPRD